MNPHFFIYDGRCGLCKAFRDWLMENCKPGTFEAIAFDDPRIVRILPDKTRAEIVESAHVVMPDGRVKSGSAAILVALSVRWWGRGLAAILSFRVFDPFLRSIYTWISQNRYRLSCKIPEEKT